MVFVLNLYWPNLEPSQGLTCFQLVHIGGGVIEIRYEMPFHNQNKNMVIKILMVDGEFHM